MSKATIILGSQWGDEGKGKIVDFLATKADIVCRFNGGNNAGHSVIANGVEYDFHLLPSGIINENCISIIGNGCVVHLPDLLKEIEKNEAKGLKNWQDRLYISDRAHLVFDLHQEIDGLYETQRGKDSLGTTRKGIGPTYASKVTRNGLRMCDLIGDFGVFENKYRSLVKTSNEMYANLSQIDIDADLNRYKGIRETIGPCVKDVTYLLSNALKQPHKTILVEGANAAMLDIDFGTYPYVTSVSCAIGGVCTGLGMQPNRIGDVIGIVKAYTTRVGLGPFVTELKDEIGEYLQRVGKEVGVTTGRKRRCGWLDLVVLKYTHMINGYTQLALTKLDVLDELDELKIAIAYKYKGQVLNSFPANMDILEEVEVEYATFAGWNESIKECRSYDMLPENAKIYVKFIQDFMQVHVRYIGVGKERESIIHVEDRRPVRAWKSNSCSRHSHGNNQTN
jgi:adenylosuccinate synthase